MRLFPRYFPMRVKNNIDVMKLKSHKGLNLIERVKIHNYMLR